MNEVDMEKLKNGLKMLEAMEKSLKYSRERLKNLSFELQQLAKGIDHMQALIEQTKDEAR